MRKVVLGLAAAGMVALAAGVSVRGGDRNADPEPPAADGAAAPDGERLRVEVLNGAGVSGIARLATRELRDRNFDVVYFGNAGGEHRDSSLVIDRAGHPEGAASIARALRIGTVVSEPDSTLYLEATVILGKDWRPRDP